MAFAHLHCHTEYSLLDGATHIYDMVKRAADLDMPAVAITDHGVMSGVPELDEACRKVKNETGKWVKPIFGCEIYFTTDSELKKQKQKLHHMILLAKNNTGYHNLLKLVSESHVDNFYYRPRTTYEMLQKYSEGIIATSACIAGIIPRCIDDGAFAEAKEWAQKFAALYEPGDFYIEIQDQGITTNAGMSQYEMNCKLTQLARELGLQTIATNDFLAAGGDTYYAFKAASANYDIGAPMDEVLMDYIRTELKGVVGDTYAKPQGRITVVKAAAPAEEPAKPAEPAAGETSYTVVSGDCLWNIAYRHYGSGAKFTAIAEANGLKDPYLINIGQVLVIPAA